MMNFILCPHKSFAWYYIDDIIIFFKTLENHLGHLNIIFSLFNKISIYLKNTKIYLDYPLIILLGQWVDEFGLTISEKWIAAIWELKFPEILKDFKTYLGFTGWLHQYIPYYI